MPGKVRFAEAAAIERRRPWSPFDASPNQNLLRCNIQINQAFPNLRSA
jgi:hypothetical protein